MSELEPQADMGSAEAKRYVYVLDGDLQLGDAFKTALTSTKCMTRSASLNLGATSERLSCAFRRQPAIEARRVQHMW